MPVLFKLVGCVNSKILEIKKDIIGELRLSNIHSIFEIYELTPQELGNIKFVANSETIKTNDTIFTINETDVFVIFVFTSVKEIKDKLIKIFSDNCINIINIKEEVPELVEADSELTKSIDVEEKDIIHELDDKIVNAINLKTIELFKHDDFKHLVRIYYSNQDIMKDFFSYIVNGDIVRLNIIKSVEKDYNEEIIILQSLGITEDTEIIRKCLDSVNGHLNLALRLLLCKRSLFQ